MAVLRWSGDRRPDAIEPLAESHDSTVILGDSWLMFGDSLLDRALTPNKGV